MALRPTLPTAAAGRDDRLPLPLALLQELHRAIREIRCGAIELVIHDGRVVPLKWREKVRLEQEVTPEQR